MITSAELINKTDEIPWWFVNPSAERMDPLGNVKFEGLNLPQEQWVRKVIIATGLPTNNLREVKYLCNPRHREALLGSWTNYEGKMRLYKSLGDYPPIAQLATITHELAHASQEKLKAAQVHAGSIAEQTILTGVFLNPYHRALYERMQLPTNHKDYISYERFCKETHAIMIELKFTNAAHLEQVDNSQRKKMDRVGYKYTGIVEGVNSTLIQLIDGVENEVLLEAKIANARRVAQMGPGLMDNPFYVDNKSQYQN